MCCHNACGCVAACVRVWLQSYSRGVVIAPFMDDPSCNVIANLTNNGMYFLGFPEGQHKVHYNGETERARSSFMPDTFDGPMKLGLMELGSEGEGANFTIGGKPPHVEL